MIANVLGFGATKPRKYSIETNTSYLHLINCHVTDDWAETMEIALEIKQHPQAHQIIYCGPRVCSLLLTFRDETSNDKRSSAVLALALHHANVDPHDRFVLKGLNLRR